MDGLCDSLAIGGGKDAHVDFDGSVLSVLSWLDNEHYIERRGGADPSDGGLLKVHAVTGEREPLFDMADVGSSLLLGK